ncbi:uncharacterized protein LOC120175724 [Hibiscus syriacus]|uniref:uncharacterized protein LOC120175724 n=1 Tax=Hibiscus syriacus TaxID=106335 RepID=UPI0019244818|nr:uncharacterized protein LOC120175724 [Hibiscus syriacus]
MSKLRAFLARLRLSRDGNLLAELRVELELVRKVMELQGSDSCFNACMEKVCRGEASGFELQKGNIFFFKNQLCVPPDTQLRNKILHEAHSSMFFVHLSSNKMYDELRSLYQWPGIKTEMSEFVA